MQPIARTEIKTHICNGSPAPRKGAIKNTVAMNNARRKDLRKIVDKLDKLMYDLDTLTAEEQTYYDNMPETIQAGEKGGKVHSALCELSSAYCYLLDAQNSILEAID